MEESHYDFERLAAKICDFICTFKCDVTNIQITPNSNQSMQLYQNYINAGGNSPKDKPGSKIKNETNLKEFENDVVSECCDTFDNVLEDFKAKVLCHMIHATHPFNFCDFPSPNSFPTVFGEILTSTFGGLTSSMKTNPSLAELESITMDMYARLLDLPKCFMFDLTSNNGGGCFHETNYDVIHSILLAARNRYIEFCTKSNCHNKDDWQGTVVVYASDKSALEIQQMCHAEFIKFHSVTTDENGIMTASALKYAMDIDIGSGLKPILIVASFGTFINFAFDEIDEIGDLIDIFDDKTTRCWLHIDGYYGGNSLLLKRFSRLYKKGLDKADSIAISPNQWLQVGLNCVALWVKSIVEFQNSFTVPLDLRPKEKDLHFSHHNSDDKKIQYNFKCYGIQSARRSKALNLWLTFRLYGKHGLEKRLRKATQLIDKLAEVIEEYQTVEIVLKRFTFLNFVLPNRNDQLNECFYNNLINTRKILVMPVHLNGRFTIRFSILNEHLKEKHMYDIASVINKTAEDIIKISY